MSRLSPAVLGASRVSPRLPRSVREPANLVPHEINRPVEHILAILDELNVLSRDCFSFCVRNAPVVVCFVIAIVTLNFEQFLILVEASLLDTASRFFCLISNAFPVGVLAGTALPQRLAAGKGARCTIAGI